MIPNKVKKDFIKDAMKKALPMQKPKVAPVMEEKRPLLPKVRKEAPTIDKEKVRPLMPKFPKLMPMPKERFPKLAPTPMKKTPLQKMLKPKVKSDDAPFQKGYKPGSARRGYTDFA